MPTAASSWTDDALFELFDEIASVCAHAVTSMRDRRERGSRPGQYGLDLKADEAALNLLDLAGLGVLSEESGLRRADAPIVVIIDPVDGSTNASRHVPWYATSLCAVDGDGPRVALVRNLATGSTWRAVRGGGATLDGDAVSSASTTEVGRAVVALSGYPPSHLGWRQYRAYGAAALDLCAVASGHLDAYIDCSPSAHGVWDYAGGLLVCREAGAVIGDAANRELLVLDDTARRTPIAAATPELYDALFARRAEFPV